MGIIVSVGSNRSYEVEDQVMISMLIVWIAVLMKSVMKIPMTSKEQMPPDAVLYSLSYWNRRN